MQRSTASFVFEPTALPGLIRIRPPVFRDRRGSFRELYRESAFAAGGIGVRFVQTSQSVSRKGVIRGLHLQMPPAAQAKLVRVVSGCIWDVAVDLRPGGETFGKWVGEEMAAEAWAMVFVPEGFAHGFAVLSERAVVEYMVTREHAPECERGIVWNDPDLAVPWPVDHPLVSHRDRSLPRLAFMLDAQATPIRWPSGGTGRGPGPCAENDH